MNTNPISINYSDEKLRILVEEYIMQQRSSFTIEGVCSYILYWAMEDGCINGTALYDCDKMCLSCSDRVKSVLEMIVGDGRITKGSENYQVLNS